MVFSSKLPSNATCTRYTEEVLLTICDADTYFDTQFMDCLAYHHVQDPTPYNTTYQAVECFFPNIWVGLYKLTRS
jgi:hypothetical protein